MFVHGILAGGFVAVLFFAVGFLLCRTSEHKLRRAQRERMMAELATERERNKAERSELAVAHQAQVEAERQRLRQAQAQHQSEKAELDAQHQEQRGQLAALAQQLDAKEAELQKVRAADSRDAILLDVLAPVLERDRVARELAALSVEDSVGHGIEALLDQVIAIGKGRFDRAVLADESGLAVAASRNTENIDALAGLSSLLLQAADKAPRLSLPAPESFVLHAANGELLLYRIFHSKSRRYVLMLGTDDPFITPELLQTVVHKLKRLLPD